jgi:hypothetical protein
VFGAAWLRYEAAGFHKIWEALTADLKTATARR